MNTKKIIPIFLVLIFPSIVLGAVTDNFNRADESPLGNGTWEAQYGLNDNQIVGNQCTGTTTGLCGSVWTANDFPAGQYAQIVFRSDSSNSGVGVILRGSETEKTFYRCLYSWQDDVVYVDGYDAGVYFSVGSSSVAMVSGDVFRAEIEGTTITLKKNGTTIDTFNDSRITSGRPGITGTSVTVCDDFEAGEIIKTCTKYASTAGSGSTCSLASPCTLSYAVSNAVAGDVWCLREGTYTQTGHLTTANSGTSGHPITFQPFPGETATITNASGYQWFIENSYWTLDGLIVNCANLPDHDQACINVGYNSEAYYFTFQNGSMHLTTPVGHDNIACIRLQAGRSSYAYIYNSVFRGSGDMDISGPANCGIQYLGGGNVGTKVLKDEFYDNYIGVYVKHSNSDTAGTGAEIAYNYLHDNGHGLYGVPVYIDYHDNLLVDCDFMFGDNGGGISGHYSTINHNTVFGSGQGIHLLSQSSDVSGDTGAIHGMTITNNIFPSKTTESYTPGDTETLQALWDHNLYGNSGAIGAHDIGQGSATYTGGSSPSTVAGFALTSESYGYGTGSEGSNMGADVSQVYGYAGGGDTTPPVISSPLPEGSQSCVSDPRDVTLQLTTDENATCKYGTSDVAYASLPNTFTTTGTTSHSTTVLSACGYSYTYYVRCQDSSGNANTASTQIGYSVAAREAVTGYLPWARIQ